MSNTRQFRGSKSITDRGAARLAFTAYLNVKFKKPLRTPQVVVVRGQVKKVEGRKLYVKGRCEDKDGMTFAEADGLWVLVTEARQEEALLASKM